MSNAWILFKTEANKDIGSGHFVRSLILADEFAKKKISVLFIFSCTEEHYLKLLIQKGYGYRTISKKQAMQPTYYQELASELNPARTCVVFDTDDEAYTEESFQLSLKELGVPFMHITVNDQRTYYSNILLCQNIIAFKQNYHTDEGTARLLGPEYFIYKPIFRNERTFEKRAFDVDRATCLICFGGADKHNLSLQTAKLLQASVSGLMMNIVVGSSYPYLQEMEQWARAHDSIHLYHNTADMYRIIKESDFAITSGGLILWEAAVLNKPAFAIATSERERAPLAYLEELGYITYLETAQQWNKKLLLSCLADLTNQWDRLQNMACRFKSRINPNGVSLVVENIIRKLEWSVS